MENSFHGFVGALQPPPETRFQRSRYPPSSTTQTPLGTPLAVQFSVGLVSAETAPRPLLVGAASLSTRLLPGAASLCFWQRFQQPHSLGFAGASTPDSKCPPEVPDSAPGAPLPAAVIVVPQSPRSLAGDSPTVISRGSLMAVLALPVPPLRPAMKGLLSPLR